ncbi:hypothetical protein KUCAC02_009410, partial [Chaenocephalus aceratus]
NSTSELNSSCGGKDPLWSPSSLCGMATPPSSRGMSPQPRALPQCLTPSSRFHCTSGGKERLPPALQPPPPASQPIRGLLHNLLTSQHSPVQSTRKDRRQGESSKPALVRQEPVKETEKSAEDRKTEVNAGAAEIVSMTLTELSVFMKKQELELQLRTEKEREEAAITEELLEDHRGEAGAVGQRGEHQRGRERKRRTGSGGQQEFSPRSVLVLPVRIHPIDHHLHRSPSAPDDEVGKFGMFSPSPCSKTPGAIMPYESFFDLALPRAVSLFVGQKTSEAVLDRLVQQGSDTHDKVLKRLPLPSKSADWTHFGGSAPLDELHTLRSQLLLLHNQLLYERYKREQHAVRNRRLLRRIINATALEEQNNAMKDQLNLQSVDIVSLRESLQVEQQRYRQLWDDRETVVTRLHSQIRQLQQGRDDYYTKNQELQSKLQEGQKRIDDLEMTIKLSNSESTQQQMSFLNKQLLLLGEAHKLSKQDLQHGGTDNTKSYGNEVETLKQSLLVQGQKLEAAQQRVAELETHLSKKEHLIAEQKKFLEDVKCQAKAELQASDSRYQAQRRITQILQTELLQLYSRVEMEAPVSTVSSPPPGGRADPQTCADSSVTVPGGRSKPHTIEELVDGVDRPETPPGATAALYRHGNQR